MNPADFIGLAIKLSSSRGEAELRTSVSRAYYGAFHSARDLLEECGIGFPSKELSGADVHRKLQFCLANAGDRDSAFAARGLSSLRRWRNAADYDLKTNGSLLSDGRQAKTVMQTAIDVVDAIQRCRTVPPSGKFRESVRAYAREVLRLPVRDE